MQMLRPYSNGVNTHFWVFSLLNRYFMVSQYQIAKFKM